MAYLAVLGASRGRLAGFSAVLGDALGLALLGIAVGLGGGSLVLNNCVVYESLRWAGALYLCWLAFDSWREAHQPIEAVTVDSSHFIHFRRGFVTNLLNPKAALFFIAVLPESFMGRRFWHTNWRFWFPSMSASPRSCTVSSWCWQARLQAFFAAIAST